MGVDCCGPRTSNDPNEILGQEKKITSDKSELKADSSTQNASNNSKVATNAVKRKRVNRADYMFDKLIDKLAFKNDG